MPDCREDVAVRRLARRCRGDAEPMVIGSRRLQLPRLAPGGDGVVLAALLALLGACTGTPDLFSSQHRRDRAAAGHRDRHRPGQGRADPAAVGARQCRHRGAVDEERRRDGAGRIQQPEHPASGEGRRRHAAAARSRPRSRRLNEGAEIILGPLFAQSVARSAQVARARGMPVIAFSTDASVAARGVYLLSFLPEIRRRPHRRLRRRAAASARSRRWCRTMPMARWSRRRSSRSSRARAGASSRWNAIRSTPTQMQAPARLVAQAARGADAMFIPDGADAVPPVVQALTRGRRQSSSASSCSAPDCGTIRASSRPGAAGRLVCRAGFHRLPQFLGALSQRASARIRCAPRRWPMTRSRWSRRWSRRKATQRFSEQVLTNSSGFAGIDGVFRFRTDGTNERGLAVLRVGPTGGQVISPPPRAFARLGILTIVGITPPDRPPPRRAPESPLRDAQAAVVRRSRPSPAPTSVAMRAGIERAAGQRGEARRDRCLRRAAAPSAGIRRRAPRASACRR